MSRKRGNRPGDPVGVCIIDKPAGCTSHDVVARVRKQLDTPRVGHAGTLDPMATGVLVLGVGAATKLLTFVTGVSKTYEARIRFGVETDSLDADGEVTATHDMVGLDPAAVAAAAATLTGDIAQVPPMVSALRVDGRRLHELAREGIEVEREPRPVTVHRFDLRPTDDPLVWDATVECSSGTYVRTLAADLILGLIAHAQVLQVTHALDRGEQDGSVQRCCLVQHERADHGATELREVCSPAQGVAQVRRERPHVRAGGALDGRVPHQRVVRLADLVAVHGDRARRRRARRGRSCPAGSRRCAARR